MGAARGGGNRVGHGPGGHEVKLTITVDLNNSDFLHEEDGSIDYRAVEALVTHAAGRIGEGTSYAPIRDGNGNRVGQFTLTD